MADSLRDSIHELRARKGNVHYRILYFFHGRNVAVLAHALVKKTDQVPPGDIDLAVARRLAFAQDPQKHTFYWEEAENGEED
jgi:phage-related protein